MWESDAERYSEIVDAELELLSSAGRRDPARVRSLLAPDFAEIGASGRRWTVEDTVTELLREDARPTPETSEWLFNALSPGLILINYRIVTPTGGSRRSSIWQLTPVGPILRFHQGTRVVDG